MHESMFSNKITLTTPTGLNTVRVDIIKGESYVEIRLIDTSSIFSLYVCSITSSDYYIIKRDQDILVDYDRFVQVLINLFHGTASNKYSATFNDGVLRFIENCEFRNICRLELKFNKPEEAQFKRYLGDLLGRMESDNIKLIKENSILRDRCMNGDRELKEKIRFLESENTEIRRRYELVSKDQSLLEGKLGSKEEEIARLTNKIYCLENENSQLRYELEKFQRENSLSYKEQLKTKESQVEEITKEMATANDLIKRLRQENLELKEYKKSTLASTQRESEMVDELREKIEELSKKLTHSEAKYKKVKEENKEKTQKIDNLLEQLKNTSKRLENAQNVYNHFYSKKVDDHADNFSDTFSLRPESPPPS